MLSPGASEHANSPPRRSNPSACNALNFTRSLSIFKRINGYASQLLGNDSRCGCGNISVAGIPIYRMMPASVHDYFRLDDPIPVLQIHVGAISLSIVTGIRIRSLNHHQLDVTCSQCNTKLVVYASRSGVFCQFWTEPTLPVSGSLPNEAFIVPLINQVIPASIRPLFRQRDLDAPAGRARAVGDDLADDEMMFSRQTEPIVGCYSEVGRFVTDHDFLSFGQD
jgi:hypothetical protein